MANTIFTDEVAKARAAYDVALKAANDALKDEPVDMEAYRKALADLTAAEKKYADNAAKALYVKVRDDAEKNGKSPVREIIRTYDYAVIGHREVTNGDKDDPEIVSVDEVPKTKQIDLLAFCKMNGIDTSWANTASKFNQLMCLRTATNVGYSKDELKALASTYYLADAVESIEMGGTPTSNNQVCKLMQRVVDEVLMPTDAEKFTVNGHDVAYLDALYAKRSTKARITLSVSKDEFVRRVLVDVMYRVLTGGRYGVDGFKVKKS